MKMQKGIKTRYYEVEYDGFTFEVMIEVTASEFNAWLRAKEYGVMEHMYGLPREYDNSVTGQHVVNTYKDIVDAVELFLFDDIQAYMEEHMAEDIWRREMRKE